MALITSISGIRGTIGPGDDNLNPLNLISFLAAFKEELDQKKRTSKNLKIVLGRDGRSSGAMFLSLATSTLLSLGVDVLNLDLATTPTVEMTVILEKADGGVIISASHNPMNWNALKLLNSKGEFLDKETGERVIARAKKGPIAFVAESKLGCLKNDFSYHFKHIDEILKLSLVKKSLIKSTPLKIVVDGVNSVGSLVVPQLLKALGIKEIISINSEIEGKFNHDPEPIEKNLKQLCQAVLKHQADLGLAVDPDVDRLAIVDDLGRPIGEEYTLVSVADYVFKNLSKFKNKYKAISVSNLSSSMALEDLSLRFGFKYQASAVGEINVVNKMKEVQAVIGGEGNGGIIYPELHYGRDALVGIALFLSYLVSSKQPCSELRKTWPQYFLLKEKIVLDSKVNIDKLLNRLEKKYQDQEIIKIDGLKIIFKNERAWVHLRRSNTEPLIRIYCEASSRSRAQNIFKEVSELLK